MRAVQRIMKLRLPPDGRPEYIRRLDEAILNDHRRREPLACAEQFARVLRAAAQEAMREVTTCPAPLVGSAIVHARRLAAILVAACRYGLVPEAESTITSEGGWSCHTVADHAAALERTVRDGRAPRFASARDEQYDALNTKVDTLAAMVAAMAAKVGVRAEEVYHD